MVPPVMRSCVRACAGIQCEKFADMIPLLAPRKASSNVLGMCCESAPGTQSLIRSQGNLDEVPTEVVVLSREESTRASEDEERVGEL